MVVVHTVFAVNPLTNCIAGQRFELVAVSGANCDPITIHGIQAGITIGFTPTFVSQAVEEIVQLIVHFGLYVAETVAEALVYVQDHALPIITALVPFPH